MKLKNNQWHWGACGKHFVSRDYFKTGVDDPFLRAFSEWIQNGYQKLDADKLSLPGLCSWRFWAKGPKKGVLICGIARQSSDSVGRPFPLLIMGNGLLKGWEDHWHLLPDEISATWGQMEYISAKRFSDFEQFEDEVRMIPSPSTDWGSPGTDMESGSMSWAGGEPDDWVTKLFREKTVFITIGASGSGDPQFAVAQWHKALRSRSKEIPSALFMGGTSEKTYMAVFMRALVPLDFVRLWRG